MRHRDAEAMCEGKRRYKSRSEAKRVRIARQQQGASKHLRAYECPICHGYHLTSAKPHFSK